MTAAIKITQCNGCEPVDFICVGEFYLFMKNPSRISVAVHLTVHIAPFVCVCFTEFQCLTLL